MSFVENFAMMLEKAENACLTIHEKRCISVRNRNAGCLRCANVCTSGCLHVENGTIEVSPEKCIGCGTCATACPTCAIEVTRPSDAQLASELKHSIAETKGHPVIACERALAWERYLAEEARKAEKQGIFGSLGARREAPSLPYNEDVLVQPVCLGRLDESFLLEAAAFGAKDVMLIRHHCEKCPYKTGGELAQEVAKSARNLLGVCGSTCEIIFSDDLPERVREIQEKEPVSLPVSSLSYDETKRDALKDVKMGAFAFMAVTVAESFGGKNVANKAPSKKPAHEKVSADGTLSHYVPARRTAVFNCMERLEQSAGLEKGSCSGQGAGLEQDSCSGQGAGLEQDSCSEQGAGLEQSSCSEQGAGLEQELDLGQTNAEWATSDTIDTRIIGAIEIDTEKCTSCRMCAVFCPSGAISKYDDENNYGIIHRPTLCMQCRCCEQICPAGAIHVKSEVPTQQFLGRVAVYYMMEKPEWTPNKPDSLFNKIHSVIGSDLEMCSF